MADYGIKRISESDKRLLAEVAAVRCADTIMQGYHANLFNEIMTSLRVRRPDCFDGDDCIGPFPTKAAVLDGCDFKYAHRTQVRRIHAGLYEVSWQMFRGDEWSNAYWVAQEEIARRNGADIAHAKAPGSDDD